MRRTNQDEASRLLVSVIFCVLTITICAPGASAGTIFFDNFNDGDAQDGMPVTWVPGSGTWNASSGDYVATGSLPRVSRVPDYVLGDTSARAQVRVVGNLDAGIAVRRPMFNQGYACAIRPDGSMAIARVDGLPVMLGSAVVPFNPGQQDVMLQCDAFGDKLSLWAWPVGDPMPDQPQIVVFDGTYAEGPVGLISAGFSAVPSDTTIFRSIQVANTHLGTSMGDPNDCNADGLVDIQDTLCATADTIGDILAAANLIPGDADGNGNVEFADFVTLSNRFGQDGNYQQGNFDLIEGVAFADFVLLSNNFGKTAGAAAAVPEPSGTALILAGMLLLRWTVRRFHGQESR